jgi:hypothetical protein
MLISLPPYLVVIWSWHCNAYSKNLSSHVCVTLIFSIYYYYFETGFLCIALPVLELTHAGLELRNLPASASQVLGLKVCATTPGLVFTIFNDVYISTCRYVHVSVVPDGAEVTGSCELLHMEAGNQAQSSARAIPILSS